jgi:hypothetical protein
MFLFNPCKAERGPDGPQAYKSVSSEITAQASKLCFSMFTHLLSESNVACVRHCMACFSFFFVSFKLYGVHLDPFWPLKGGFLSGVR